MSNLVTLNVQREVQIGELAEQLDSLAVAGLGRGDLVVENPYVEHLPAFVHARGPLLAPGRNPGESRDAVDGPSVVRVLARGADAQVGLSVVQRIVIDVIDHLPRRGLHDLPMHQDETTLLVPDGVVLTILGTPRVPLVLAEPFIVGRIDNGVLPLGQPDVAHLRIGRLRRHDPRRRLAGLAADVEVPTHLSRQNLHEPTRAIGTVRTDRKDHLRFHHVSEALHRLGIDTVDAIETASFRHAPSPRTSCQHRFATGPTRAAPAPHKRRVLRVWSEI